MLKKFKVTGKLRLKLLSKLAFRLSRSSRCTELSELPWDRLKFITLILLLFACGKRPCFLGKFEGFSGLARDIFFW